MWKHIGMVTAGVVLWLAGNLPATLILEGSGYSALGNSNSVVIDEIEYYIETDKSVYQVGEDVEMLFRVTNLSDQNKSVTCYRLSYYNQMVRQNDQMIWVQFNGYLTTIADIDLEPKEVLVHNYTWNMIDYNNNLISPGMYDVVGIMYSYPVIEVSVPIQVVPEPVTLVLLLAGSVVLSRKKQNKHI